MYHIQICSIQVINLYLGIIFIIQILAHQCLVLMAEPVTESLILIISVSVLMDLMVITVQR